MNSIKRMHLYIGVFIALFAFSGCVSKYKNTDAHEYATLELISQSEKTLFADDYYAEISDYSHGCEAIESLGVVISDNKTESKVVKIPVGKPLKINANYNLSSYDDITVILTPKNKAHYIIEYIQDNRQFYFYMKKGKQKVDIPDSDIRMFHVRECL